MTEGNKLAMFLYHCCGVEENGRGEVMKRSKLPNLKYFQSTRAESARCKK
jgi:hypothetical protein